jgi:hypothetical protein
VWFFNLEYQRTISSDFFFKKSKIKELMVPVISKTLEEPKVFMKKSTVL